MKSLVEAECGQANALVDLSRNFGASNSRVVPSGADGVVRSLLPGLSPGEQFAEEFLSRRAYATPAPATFSMKALAQNLPAARSVSASDVSRAWAADFARRHGGSSALATQWAQQYTPTTSQTSISTTSTAQAELDAIWGQALAQNQPSQATMAQMWSTEYLDHFDSGAQVGALWADEFSKSGATAHQSSAVPEHAPLNKADLEREWENMMAGAGLGDAFVDDFMLPEPTYDYVFQSSNPFIGDQTAVSRGSEFMHVGNISEAIQCFEAAVQQNPQDAKAWCQLGLSLAENEQDDRAILAYRKSLNIDPGSRDSLLAMSVSLANENLDNEALVQLEKWITAYSNPRASIEPPSAHPLSSFALLDSTRFSRIEATFLAAARQQQSVDPALQNALGVLYNLGKNYDRAIDCLRAALSVRQDDARLWNRLGATLANSDRTPEAIAAYRHALDLFPTYVRARYNLGISCMHLKSYREAVNHFLLALQLQKSPQSSPIWSTLRSAALRMEPQMTPEFMTALDHRNVDAVSAELSRLGGGPLP